MSARSVVEHRICRRHGLCLAVAPAAFEIGADGRVRVTGRSDPQAVAEARQAARLCPVQAIRVSE